jgi:hypothetical protein
LGLPCSPSVYDELAYADVLALRRQRIPADGLLESLIERIATVDAPDTPTALRSVLPDFRGGSS